jgi:hypothetical protein
MYHTCALAKAKRRAKKSSVQTKTTERDGELKTGNLKVGARVYLDHFESRLLGRTYDSYWKPSSTKLKVGALYVNHDSGFAHCEHQVGFSAGETIRGKQKFEKMCMDNGVVVQDYLTDSGTFKAHKFVSHMHETQQTMHFCGTNSHHQNGVAERAIQTISNMARAMILHESMHWKDIIDASLLPVAVNHAIHIYNNNPSKGVTPEYIFTGSNVPRHRLLDLHVWGCPVCVLYPQMQQGRKLPRWQPRSRRGVNLGLSLQDFSEVPLVLNLQTGSIETQYHVVFYDQFTTVSSTERDIDPPSHWEALCLESSVRIATDHPATYLKDDWLTEEELEEKRRYLQR